MGVEIVARSFPTQEEVWLVDLDPTVGTEIKKTRPVLVVSPNDLNQVLPRVIIAPLTTKGQPLGCRPSVKFNGKSAKIVLDQIRSVDKSRLIRPLGQIKKAIWQPTLIELFS
jgi:mRNA interferase MazF